MNREMQEPGEWREQRDATRQLKTTLFLGVIAFGVALAVVLGNKMSQTAASVVVGVAAGVVASIPTTFILFLLLRSRWQTPAEDHPMARSGRPLYARPPMQPRGMVPLTHPNGAVYQQPPVIVVTAPSGYDPRAQFQSGPVYPYQGSVLTPAPREFEVIGDQDVYWDDRG